MTEGSNPVEKILPVEVHVKPNAVVTPTEFTITPGPLGEPNIYAFALTLEWRDADKWAVCWGSQVLNTDGDFEYEPSPSNREDDFLERTRFPLGEALRRAREIVWKLKVNGRTYLEWQEHFKEKGLK